jgi:hypothetical protein
MKTKILSLSKPQRMVLLNHYRVGGGIIALHSPANNLTTLHIYVDRSGILRSSATDKPVYPLSLRTPAGTSTLPYDPPSYANDQQTEVRTQALAICQAAHRHLAEIDAIGCYRHEAVRTVLQREATGWTFRVIIGKDPFQLLVDAPEGLSWILARDTHGSWYPCPEEEKAYFEQAWGGCVYDTWTQRVLNTAAYIIGQTYGVYPMDEIHSPQPG